MNEVTAKVVINESYKPLIIFATEETSSQNNDTETTTPRSRQILTPRKREGSKLYEGIENIKTKFTELENLLMTKICYLTTNYAPDSELDSKKEIHFTKINLYTARMKKYYF